jgi:hypothetical protein
VFVPYELLLVLVMELLSYGYGLAYLRRLNRSSTADQLDEKHHQRHDKQDVDIPSDYVESDESQKPSQE